MITYHAELIVMPHQLLIVSQTDHLLIPIHILNDKQCRSRSVGFRRSRLIWTYNVCKGGTYPGSAGPGLILMCQFNVC